MTVYDCMTVFWRCLLYRDREKHGTHLCFEIHWVRTPLVLSARTVASSTRPSRWPAASPPRRLPTLLMCTYYSVLHAMATMPHDDCSPMIATMNFARCSRTRGVCRRRICPVPAALHSLADLAAPRGGLQLCHVKQWCNVASYYRKNDDYIASHDHI